MIQGSSGGCAGGELQACIGANLPARSIGSAAPPRHRCASAAQSPPPRITEPNPTPPPTPPRITEPNPTPPPTPPRITEPNPTPPRIAEPNPTPPPTPLRITEPNPTPTPPRIGEPNQMPPRIVEPNQMPPAAAETGDHRDRFFSALDVPSPCRRCSSAATDEEIFWECSEDCVDDVFSLDDVLFPDEASTRRRRSRDCKSLRSLQELARRELAEDKKVRSSCVSELVRFASAHPRLRQCNLERSYLLRFCRAQKFDVERAKQALEKFLTSRIEHPQWFTRLDPLDERIHELTSSGYCFVLPSRDSCGRRVVVNVAAGLDPSRHTNSDVLRTFMTTFEALLEDEENQIRGFSYIFHCRGVRLSHCGIWTPSEAGKMFNICEKNLPMRHCDINFVAPPFGIGVIIDFCKSFLSEKLRGRIHTISSDEKLCRKFSAEILPPEFGGSGPALKDMTDRWQSELAAKRSRLQALDDKLNMTNE